VAASLDTASARVLDEFAAAAARARGAYVARDYSFRCARAWVLGKRAVTWLRLFSIKVVVSSRKLADCGASVTSPEGPGGPDLAWAGRKGMSSLA
jgi:hypothetical protein